MRNQIYKLLINILWLVSPFLLIVAIYVSKDPFKVLFGYSSYYKSGDPSYVMLNRDYVSTETFIKQYPKYQYDSFIFGNSRTLFYEVEDIKRYLPQSKFFHFDASSETIYGIYHKVKYLAKQKVLLKNVVLVLDVETLSEVENSTGHIYIKHPKLSHTSSVLFHFEFIKTFFDINFLKEYLPFTFFNIPSEKLDNRPFNYELQKNELKFSFYEKMIAENPETFYVPRHHIFYKRDRIQQISEPVISDRQREMLKEISAIFKKDKTLLKIIINPLYDQKKFSNADIQSLNAIFGQENVFDFSGINTITENKYNYYETSHYRPHVSKQLIDSVYKK